MQEHAKALNIPRTIPILVDPITPATSRKLLLHQQSYDHRQLLGDVVSKSSTFPELLAKERETEYGKQVSRRHSS